eukprot:jgi/Chrzof1/4105/UNPLg00766.t1
MKDDRNPGLGAGAFGAVMDVAHGPLAPAVIKGMVVMSPAYLERAHMEIAAHKACWESRHIVRMYNVQWMMQLTSHSAAASAKLKGCFVLEKMANGNLDAAVRLVCRQQLPPLQGSGPQAVLQQLMNVRRLIEHQVLPALNINAILDAASLEWLFGPWHELVAHQQNMAPALCTPAATVIPQVQLMTSTIADADIISVVIRVSLAADHMHKHGLAHSDIKLENILLTQDGHAKLGDLGMATRVDVASGTFLLVGGTPTWMPPEVHDQKAMGAADVLCTTAIDWWSIGCVALQMACSGFPARLLTNISIPFLVQSGMLPAVLAGTGISPQLQGLIAGLLDPNPVTRLGLQSVRVVATAAGCDWADLARPFTSVEEFCQLN